MGCLLAGGPLVGMLGLSYTAYFLGPTALLGSAVFILFYPTMVRLQQNICNSETKDRKLIKFKFKSSVQCKMKHRVDLLQAHKLEWINNHTHTKTDNYQCF